MQDFLHFPASKKKAVLILLGSLVFIALGVWLKPAQPLLGWACIIFFSLGIPAALVMAFSKKIYLRLDAQGFEMGSLVKTVRVAWTEVDGFQMVSLKGAKMIAIHYNGMYQDQRALRRAARALSNIEGAIANSYSAPLPVILQHLQAWHARYAGLPSNYG